MKKYIMLCRRHVAGANRWLAFGEYTTLNALIVGLRDAIKTPTASSIRVDLRGTEVKTVSDGGAK